MGSKDTNPGYRYNLTRTEYDRVMAEPCGLCGTTERRRVADHKHATGRFRGPLCNECNTALGYIEKMGTEWLQKAVLWAV
jgi:hypothetical protein